MNHERFEAPEAALFSGMSVVDAVCQSAGGRLSSLRLVGKGSLYPGLAERMRVELRMRGRSVSIDAPPNRALITYSNAGYIVAANLDLSVQKETYDEHGPCELTPKMNELVFK